MVTTGAHPVSEEPDEVVEEVAAFCADGGQGGRPGGVGGELELAANAALHSRSRLPGGQFTVRAELHPGDYVWIEVEDSGRPWLETAADSTQGHGLDIIGALASDWAVDGDHINRIVWARFDWPHPG